MYRRKAAISFLGVLFVLVSCVDSRYDLVNKDISTDVKIEGNRIAVPIGNLKAITLDSIVDTDEIDILEKGDDGLFRINVSDTIDTVRVEIDPVKLSVDPQTHSEVINFETVEIDTVHIEATNIDPIEFKAREITLDSLNKKLPRLTSSVKTPIESDEIDAFFDILEKNPSLIKPKVIPIKNTFGTEEPQYVSCDFEYELPSEVEEINTIWLGSSKSSTGTLVEVVVTTSSLFENVNKTVDFTITFPDYFVLYTDKYTQPKDNVITVDDLELKGTRNVVSFYIKAIKDISDKIDEKSGVLKIDDDINYSLEYKLDGNVELSSDIKREDLDFNLGFDVQLAFSDAEGSLKDIYVGFEPIEMDFKTHFDDLEHIDEIYYVDFNEDESFLKFVSTMDTAWLGGFAMKDGYALKVQFPHNISINDNKSTYEGKGSKIIYSADDHAFYIYDLKALADTTHWNLALDRLDLNVPVVGESCDIDVMAKVYFVDAQKESVDSLVLGGIHTESMVETLYKLKGKKSATFSMEATDLVIDDASVHTEVITSSLDTSTDFTINEEIPEDIGCIEGIDFCDKVVMNIDLGVSGLDDLNTDVRLDIDVDMPSFLVIKPQNNSESGVVITKDGNRLHIEATVNPYETPHLGFGLECERLDFMTEEFDYKGAMPNDSTDGKSYLTYDGRIKVKGEASIKGVEFHASVLERLNEIKFDITASLNDMQVKTFHGSYRGEIDPVEESIEIDLGEELDFLKEEGNSITLAEPQIEIVLKNTICVPVDVEMQIHSKDDKGVTISSITVDKNHGVSILPAKYDERTGNVEPVTTKIFLTADSTRVSKIGYNNVEIKELANLLERIPDNIEFKIQPIVDQSCTHHVDITDTLTFSGTYDVNIPLKFDEFNFVYNDTITGLAESLGENVDMLSNIKLNAKMNITNTIPLALKMGIEPLDIDGNRIDGMEVDSVFIKAGNGGAINGSDQESQEVVLSIKSKSGDFSLLDMLSLSINAASDHTTGSVGIKGAQGIRIEDILLEIFGDIEMDLNE